jgi:hypothetical protein
MDRRLFLIGSAAALLAPLSALASATPSPIKYWVVVGDVRPFVLGILDDAELASLKNVRDGRFRTADEARCRLTPS